MVVGRVVTRSISKSVVAKVWERKVEEEVSRQDVVRERPGVQKSGYGVK